MTITIGNPWQLLGCIVLAGVLLYVTAAIVIMIMWGGGWPRVVTGWITAAAGLTGAVLLVLAGGGWL